VHRAGEHIPFVRSTHSGDLVTEDLAADTRTDAERRGITIGILVVALLCLSLFFVWHHYGDVASPARPSAGATH
jgi:hypothetical protein